MAQETAADLHFVAAAESRQKDRGVVDDLGQVCVPVLALELLGLFVENAESLVV